MSSNVPADTDCMYYFKFINQKLAPVKVLTQCLKTKLITPPWFQAVSVLMKMQLAHSFVFNGCDTTPLQSKLHFLKDFVRALIQSKLSCERCWFQTQRFVRVYNLLKQQLMKKLQSNCKWVSSMDIHHGGNPRVCCVWGSGGALVDFLVHQ